MAKKIDNKKKEEVITYCDNLEPVTNSCLGKRPIGPSGDRSAEVVANCDQLVKYVQIYLRMNKHLGN